MLFIIMAAELGGQQAGNYIHESSLFSLVPYIPAMVGLLVIGRLLEKWGGAEASVKQNHP